MDYTVNKRNHNNKTVDIVYNIRKRNLKLFGYSTYAEYLNSPEWFNIKKYLRTFPRFNICSVCLETKNLHFHHTKYSYEAFKYGQDIVCLCSKCHNFMHQKQYATNQHLKYILRKARKDNKKNLYLFWNTFYAIQIINSISD